MGLGDEAKAFKREIGLAIYRARNENRHSQIEFAELLARQLGSPVARSEVSDWEHGKTEPRASVLLAAARAAGVTVGWMLREPGAQRS